MDSYNPAGEFFILFIRFILFIYTYITLPIYYVIQRPWETEEKRKKPSSVMLIQEAESIRYRSTAKMGPIRRKFIQENIDTLDKVFNYTVRKYGDSKVALGTREILSEEDEVQPNGKIFKKFALGGYQWRTYTQMANEADNFGRGLRELGLKAKDNVAILSETRAEWLISANGCMKQNLPLVTLYATLGEEAIIHGINHTEAACVITSHELLPKFKNILPCTPNVTVLVVIGDPLKPLEVKPCEELPVKVLPYCEVVRLGELSSRSKTEGRAPKPEDTAIIMFTSGSTGQPKGVVMSHRNVMSSMLAYSDVLITYENDIYLAFLPLAHIFELIAESICLLTGVPIGYSSPLTMTDKSSKIKHGSLGDASVLKPTITSAVPLVLDRVYKSILEKIDSGPALSKAIFNLCLKYKLKWADRGYDTPIINLVLFKRIRAILGGHVRLIFGGGAPLAPEIHQTLRAILCCPIRHAYALTETSASATVMDMDDYSMGMTGGPVTCSDVKLVNWDEGNYRVDEWPYNPRGEIHIGGDNVAMGYYKLPEKTKEDFYEDDMGVRWFRTGDIGEMNALGQLQIIDRKKDLVKLQYGEYVSLGKVETHLKTCPLVDNICVYADPTKLFAVAILMPNPGILKQIVEEDAIKWTSFEDMCLNRQVEKVVLREIQKHSIKCRLEKFEIPQAVKLVSEVWTPDTGLVTDAFKLKRKQIQEHYQPFIDRMYS